MSNKLKISAIGGNSTPNLEPITLNICNKVFQDLHDTLLQKGVSGISADNPTGLVDGVKALPANTIGGFKTDFPIAFFPKSESGFTVDNFIWDIIEDRYLRTQVNESIIKVYDLSLISFDTLNVSTDYASSALVLTIDKTTTQAATGQVFGSIFRMKMIPKSKDIAYFTNTGHIGVITPDFTDKTITATYVVLVANETSLKNNTTASHIPFASNGTKMLLGLETNTMPYIAFVDLITGEYDVQNWSFAFALNGGGYLKYDTKMYGNTVVAYSSTTSIATIDWDNIANSTASNRPYGAPSRMGFAEEEQKIYQLYYINKTLFLSIYDIGTKVEKIKSIVAPLADIFFGYINMSSIWNSCLQELCIDTLPNGNKLILSPFGTLLLNEAGEFVQPISGAPCYSLNLRNGEKIGTFTVQNSICFKYDGNYYSLCFKDSLRIGLITMYYNKIITNFYVRNQTPIFYPTNQTLTKELMDSAVFDADTISLSVEVA